MLKDDLTTVHRGARPVAHVENETPLEQQSLKARARFGIQRFTPKQQLYRQGAPATHVYEILEGTVMRVLTFPDGRRQITELLMPGMLLGFPFAERHSTSAIAATEVRVRVARQDTFFGSSAFRFAKSEQIEQQLRRSQDMVTLLGRMSATERIATVLCQVAHNDPKRSQVQQDELVIRLPIKKSDLADYLCLALETVTRVFARLETAGIIRRQNRSTIVILDLPRLTSLARVGEVQIEPQVSRGAVPSVSSEAS
jgi:CRP/FNR family transcriptional regulator